MSVMEIPDTLFLSIYHQEVARQINKGLDLIAARQMASEIMGHCFVARTTAVQCDHDFDLDPVTRDLREDWEP